MNLPADQRQDVRRYGLLAVQNGVESLKNATTSSYHCDLHFPAASLLEQFSGSVRE